MECPDYIPLFPTSFSSPWFPIAGLSSPHDQVRSLAHVVAALSRIAPRHVPGHSLVDLVAKNRPRLALRCSLLGLFRLVLFRLRSLVKWTPPTASRPDNSGQSALSDAPSLGFALFAKAKGGKSRIIFKAGLPFSTQNMSALPPTSCPNPPQHPPAPPAQPTCSSSHHL